LKEFFIVSIITPFFWTPTSPICSIPTVHTIRIRVNAVITRLESALQESISNRHQFVVHERINWTETELNIVSIHSGNIMQTEGKVCVAVRTVLRIICTLSRLPAFTISILKVLFVIVYCLI